MEPEEVPIRVAVALLEDYTLHRQQIDEQRDERVRLAYASGLSAARIAKVTGMARSTVARILREPRP